MNSLDRVLVTLAVLTALALVCAFMAIVMAAKARAHDWYPNECCSNKDCEPMSATMLPSDERGWLLPDGDVVPFDRVRKSRDHRFHWCRSFYSDNRRSPVIRPRGAPVCLFVPGGDT